MIGFLESLKRAPLLADGGIGSYLFEQTGRISESGHVYEVLNLDNPDLIRQLHFAYLQAGAQCLTTNTFAANNAQLSLVGQERIVSKLIHAGVNLARQALTEFRDQTQVERPQFILGSIGPTGDSLESQKQVKQIYIEPVESLMAAGVDALLIETFTNLDHVMALLDLLRQIPERPPLVVQFSLRQSGQQVKWELNPEDFVNNVVKLGADVVGINCCAPWEATAFIDAVQEMQVVRDGNIYFSAMPNAGGFQRIAHRYMTHVNPEYMGKLARTLTDRGVRLVGGCCEVHPPHIREMHNYLSGRLAGQKRSVVTSMPAKEPVGDEVKKANGPFSRKIKEGTFAVSVEILPTRGTSHGIMQKKVDFVKALAEAHLADALDVTDGSRGIPLMTPGDFISVLRNRLGWTAGVKDGLEFIAHFTTRDLNVMGLQSRLIGYWANQINNVLFITGDPPKMSPTYPRSTAVFDLDSVAMIHYTHTCLNSGLDFGAQPLGKDKDPETHFTIGSGFEPEAMNREHELAKLQHKIANGVEYVFTQPVFRFETLDVLEPFFGQIPILVGVMVLNGVEHARRIAQIPGVVIPPMIDERLASYDKLADQQKVAAEIAVEQIRMVRQQGWSGLYLMAPASYQSIIGVLGGGLT